MAVLPSTLLRIPNTSGIIIAAVAVLLIHIDSSAVTPNSIKTARRILPLAIANTLSAMTLSSPCTCIAAARAKPPRKRNIVELAKLFSADWVLNTPAALP